MVGQLGNYQYRLFDRYSILILGSYGEIHSLVFAFQLYTHSVIHFSPIVKYLFNSVLESTRVSVSSAYSKLHTESARVFSGLSVLVKPIIFFLYIRTTDKAKLKEV